MPTFLTLFKWTDQGIRQVKDTVKRAEKFKSNIQAAGGSAKSIYWTLGGYDGVILFEAPDEATATAIMLSGSSLGNVRTETLRAFTQDEIQGVLAKIPS